MRVFALILTVCLFTSANAEISQNIGVLGFQAWKAARVEDAKQQLEKAKAEAPATPTPSKSIIKKSQESARQQKIQRPDQRVSQAQLNLEIAEELSINDYFVLYLNQFKDRSAFIEAAQKLSAEEAADLMMAFQKSLATSNSQETSPSGAAIAPISADLTSAKR